MPHTATPQLATLSSTPPTGDDWVHELKFDGYRLLAFIEDGHATLLSRNGNDWTEQFSGLAKKLAELPCKTAILDGEAVILDAKGVSRFQKLQNALGTGRLDEVVFFAFDLLYRDGLDLRGCSLLDRKAGLHALLQNLPAASKVRFSDHVVGGGTQTYQHASAMGLEGTISKLAKGCYEAGRSRSWVKVKCIARQEFVVVGYTDPTGARSGLGALLLGVFDDESLVYCGKVGTGFSAKVLDELYQKLSPLKQPKPSVVNPLSGFKAKGVHWVKPQLVAEVAFTEWTDDGVIRHPSFQGLRQDKSPHEVKRESPAPAAPRIEAKVSVSPAKTAKRDPVVAGIRISHPDKLLYPDVNVTKLEVALYYERVAHLMLPHLRHRPLTLLRCPEGYTKACFFQKHANATVPDTVPRVMVSEPNAKREDYLMIDELPALIQLVQLSVTEFHVWGSRAPDIDRPDILVFDLDPGPDVSWKSVVTTALALRDLLSLLGLPTFPRMTGGKGLHVVVPLQPLATWPQAKAFTLAIAEEFARQAPQFFTAKITKKGREGKILIDYLRNARDATAVASLSTRARPGAYVAVPLAWSHLEDHQDEPCPVSVRSIETWLSATPVDPWIGFDDARTPLTQKLLSKVGVGS